VRVLRRGRSGNEKKIIEIDADTYDITGDTELRVREPAERLAMAQRYDIFLRRRCGFEPPTIAVHSSV
jgi:hypothetical protein